MNSKSPLSLPPSTLPGNSSETTKVMIRPPLPNCPHKCAPIFPLTNESREEIKEMLKHLPSDKAAGPDGITNSAS